VATIPDRVLAILIREGRPLQATEIENRLGDVSRSSVNRALQKLRVRKQAKYLGRLDGWVETATS